jgi:glutaredoxin
MKKWLLVSLITGMVVLALPAQAGKMYKWTDKAGNVSYQSYPPPADAGQVEEKEFGGRSQSAGNAAIPQEVLEKYPVILYSVPKCSACDMARAYLKKRGIPITEKSVGDDIAAQKEMKDKVGELTVPTITVGSKVMKGYLESILEGELDQAGYPKAGAPEQAEGEAQPGQ